MQDSLGYFCGQWIPCHQMSLAIDDIGSIQGVTAVERLRTWDGQLRLTTWPPEIRQLYRDAWDQPTPRR